jgi:hypothetical protein
MPAGKGRLIHECATMSVLDTLRKGFGYVLMSMGVSRPSSLSRPASAAKPEARPEATPEAKPSPGPESPK